MFPGHVSPLASSSSSFPRLVVLALGVTFLGVAGVGCGSKTQAAGGDVLAASAANASVVTSVITRMEQMLEAGDAIATVLTAAKDQLQADPRVHDVVADIEDGTVTVVFKDGETHTFSASDEDAGSDALSSPPVLSPAIRDPVGNDLARAIPLVAQATSGSLFRMPSGKKMLLANSLAAFHSNNPNFVVTDSTQLIGKMLAARGYEGEPRGDISVDMFSDLTSYDVIVLETHGGARPIKYPDELLGKPNCGGKYSTYNILTTEPATVAKIFAYSSDIFCGRINLYNNLTRRGGRLVVRNQFLAVTPNYIREHDPGKFADDALLFVNACSSAYAKDGSSPLRDLFFEKASGSARFLGWTGRTSTRLAVRAALNLFQLMTASNEELTGKQGFVALKKWTPPRGGISTPLTTVVSELEQKSVLTDPVTGSKLTLSIQGTGGNDLILMPHPMVRGSMAGQGGQYALVAYYAKNPTVTIGGTVVSAQEYAPNILMLTLPAGVFGDAVLTEDGRTSIARPFRRWRPQVKVSEISSGCGDGVDFLAFTGTFTLQARSSLTMESLWLTPPPEEGPADPPTARFGANWDLDASSFGWNATGGGTCYEGGGSWTHYWYDGSGLKTLQDLGGGGAIESVSTDGTTAELWACADMAYTQHWNDSAGNSGAHETRGYCVRLTPTPALTWDWTVSGGSYHSDAFGMAGGQVSWNAFPAEPPFAEDLEPR
jgi:hypothetical protein